MTHQELLPLSAATRRLPRRSNGKPIHVATLYRWARDGCRGVVLDTVQVGAQMYTTESALQEFIREVTQRKRESVPTSRPASTRSRESVHEADRAAAEALRPERRGGAR